MCGGCQRNYCQRHWKPLFFALMWNEAIFVLFFFIELLFLNHLNYFNVYLILDDIEKISCQFMLDISLGSMYMKNIYVLLIF